MISNTTKPLVSVLMTVYNREKYISEAIESVMASTYQNWELIIVDDRSKDTSVEIARHYETQDKRIKVYVNEANLGDYPNRNKAASYAEGKYLKYVDASRAISVLHGTISRGRVWFVFFESR
jgi:glycosyltransferase involved in cell wall biosynthesis